MIRLADSDQPDAFGPTELRNDHMANRDHWGSKTGFILAASGSAVGLGNIWKFPYITGENGGGAFVLIYLACILLVGIPILIGEVIIGKATQKSAVPAFRELSGEPASPWMSFGWIGVLAAFLLLSYYAVIAGWTMHYAWLSVSGSFAGQTESQVQDVFSGVVSSPGINLGWQIAFMVLTIGIVAGGIKRGIETASKIMLPALFVIMIVLLIKGATTDGFGKAASFIFGFHTDDLTSNGILEALGHSFFTLSIGMGTMVAYGSYLGRKSDAVGTGLIIGGLDTLIALVACMVLFPITFAHGFEPNAGPGLVFMNMPIALMALPGGSFFASIFFILLFFAALSSAISLLEVATSYFIDEWKWNRVTASVVTGIVITLVGIPSALSNIDGCFFNGGFAEYTGKNWFDSVDWLVSNLLLPLGGMGIALFLTWHVSSAAREAGFKEGTSFQKLYWAWLELLRWVAPIAVILVFLNAVGAFPKPVDETPAVEAAESVELQNPSEPE